MVRTAAVVDSRRAGCDRDGLVTHVATELRQVPRLGPALGAAVAISALLNTAGVFSEEAIHWANWMLGFAFIIVSAAIVFGVFVRRAQRSPARAWRTGLVFGLLGLLTVVAFWSGLPPVFAVAAMYLGSISYMRGERQRAKRAGMIALSVGALALVLDVVFYAADIATRV